jgi:exopolysaccharide production protein ExoZ
MWMVTERATTPAAFARNRVARIVPLYWLATAALAARTRPDALRLVLSLLFIPHRDPAGEIWPVLVPGWTLNYEMFFYAVFASGLLLPRRMQLWFLTGVLLALPAAGIALKPHGAVAATYTDPLLCEFLAGVWLCVAWRAGRLPGAAVGGATIAVAVVLFEAGNLLGIDAGALRALAWGLPALGLVGGALMIERSRPIPRLPALIRLGDGSYSIYLFHTLVIAALAKVFAPSPGFFLLAVAASAIAGYAVYAAVEKPIEELRKRHRAAAAAEPAA